MSNGIHPRFGRRLRELRRERGLSQSDLAERTSVTPEYVSRIERGRVGPSLAMIERLAAALAVPAKALFEFDGAPPAADSVTKRIEYLAQSGPAEDRQLLLRLAETMARYRRGKR